MSVWPGIIHHWRLQADRVGDNVIHVVLALVDYTSFLSRLIREGVHLRWIRRPAAANVLLRQIYFTGVEPLLWIAFILLAPGVLLIYNIALLSKRLNDPALLSLLVNEAFVVEMAPLLVTLILLARSGVATVTEIGNMSVRGEILLLRCLGISEYDYLYLTRALAFALCGLVWTVGCMVFTLWFAGLLLAWTGEMELMRYLESIRSGLGIADVGWMVFKGLTYPFLACTVLVYEGSRVGHKPNNIPLRTYQGVLAVLFLIIGAEVFIGVLRQLL